MLKISLSKRENPKTLGYQEFQKEQRILTLSPSLTDSILALLRTLASGKAQIQIKRIQIWRKLLTNRKKLLRNYLRNLRVTLWIYMQYKKKNQSSCKRVILAVSFQMRFISQISQEKDIDMFLHGWDLNQINLKYPKLLVIWVILLFINLDIVTNYENSSEITRQRVRRGHEDESLLSLFKDGFITYAGKYQSYVEKFNSVLYYGGLFRI